MASDKSSSWWKNLCEFSGLTIDKDDHFTWTGLMGASCSTHTNTFHSLKEIEGQGSGLSAQTGS